MPLQIPNDAVSLPLPLQIPTDAVSLPLPLQIPTDAVSLPLPLRIPTDAASLPLPLQIPTDAVSLPLPLHIPTDAPLSMFLPALVAAILARSPPDVIVATASNFTGRQDVALCFLFALNGKHEARLQLSDPCRQAFLALVQSRARWPGSSQRKHRPLRIRDVRRGSVTGGRRGLPSAKVGGRVP